jgi:hypothetical protein
MIDTSLFGDGIEESAPVGVEPTMAGLQTDALAQKRREKRWFQHRPHYHRTTILIWPESWPHGPRSRPPFAARCSP